MTHLKSQLGTQDCKTCGGTGIVSSKYIDDYYSNYPCPACQPQITEANTKTPPLGGTTERKRGIYLLPTTKEGK